MPSFDPFAAGLPSAKVRTRDRVGTEAWLKFHAAFSRRFAVAALALLAGPKALVLDPFGGSGTTARAAGAVGARCVTFDLNPALVALARATLLPPKAGEPVLERLRQRNREKHGWDADTSEVATKWLHPATASELAAWREGFASLSTIQARMFSDGLLVRAARDILRPTIGTNPTWPTPPKRRMRRDVRATLLRVAREMVRDLGASYPLLTSHDLKIREGDARAIPLQSGSVDAVLASPPYLSRIDYVRATLPELIALGYDDRADLEHLRAKIMGGVTVKGRIDSDMGSWGAKTTEILSKISSHPSKASTSYYAKLASRYMSDLEASLGEAARVLKPGGKGMIVVQTSYYKDLQIPLPDLVVEMVERRGLDAEIVHSQRITQHYGHLSPHQRAYVHRKMLSEAAVLITA